MAAEESVVSGKVQNYLDKNKISSIFEDLKSKIIKELPADPIEFLISKLQALHKQKKKVPTTRPATSSGVPSSRTRIQVTGTSVGATSKLKSPSTAKSKAGLTSSSTPSLTKTATRPTTGTGKTDTSKPSTGSKLKPSTAASPRRPTTAPATGKASTVGKSPLTSPARSAGTKTPSKPSPSPVRSTGLKSPSTTSTSSTKSTPTKTRQGLKPPATGASKPGPGTVKKTPTPQASKDKSRPITKKTVDTPAAKKSSPKEDPITAVKKETSTEQLAEFFGEPKKSSVQVTRGNHDDEELSMPVVGGDESDSESGVRGDEGEPCECTGVSNLDSLLQMKMSMKQGKSKRSPKKDKSHLRPKEEASTTPPSLGYHSGGCDESEDDECVEAVEDPAALEDEGVTGVAGKQSSALPKDARVDFVVLLCSRCAKMLTGDEPATEVSAIVVTKGAATADFESVSQVGSHASFPQWEVETEADSEVSSADKSKASSDSSNVTLVSRDTWGGLAPKARPTPVTSEEDSEVQLPAPPPLEGQPWREEPRDPHGWGERS